MSYDFIPEKLKEKPQWVMWKFVPVEGRKPTKILYSPQGFKASTTKPETWGTFTTCLQTLQEKKFDGIGYVFTKGIVGIDLDNCVNSNKSIKDWAKIILKKFDSYTEFSPSGTGLHILIESDIDFQGHKKDWIDEWGEKEGIECYMRSRYFTVTGNVFEDRKELKHISEPDIFSWYEKTFGSDEKLIVQIPNIPQTMPDDQSIVEFMRNARNGSKFRAFYDRGEWNGLPSQSEADMSLVNSLMFFCRNDMQIVDRIFRTSKLYRKKWERPDYRNELFKKCYRPQVMDWNRPKECDEPEDELIIRSMTGIKPVNVKWLWHSRLAKGKITLFQGDPGQGKSQITIYIASIISKGQSFFDGDDCEQGQVLFITAEDDSADTLKPRLMAQDANMDNIFEIQWIKTKEGRTKLFNFEKYMEDLRKATKALKDLKLIVVDPISAFLGKVDGNASGEVRGLLYELKMLAEERECSVILITHNNKNAGQKAISRASGSHAFVAAARMSYVFGYRPLMDSEERPERPEFAMAPLKNNLTKNPDTLLYTIDSAVVVGEDNEDIFTSKIDWKGTSNAEAQEIVDYNPTKPSKAGRPTEKFDNCKNELSILLKGKIEIEGKEVEDIMKSLRMMDFSNEIIKKSRESLGWRATSDGYKVKWKVDEFVANF